MTGKTTSSDKRKKRMLECLEKSLGIVTTAAHEAGVTRDSHYRWYRDDPAYRLAVDGLKDVALDFAEDALRRRVDEGSDAAIIFFLKCRGKDRGYIERQQIDVDAQSIVKLDLSALTSQELEVLASLGEKLVNSTD